MDTQTVFAPGGLPCAALHRSTAPPFLSMSWNTPAGLGASGPSAITCGSVPLWCSSCTTNHWAPTVQLPPRGTSIPTRCDSGDDAGPTATIHSTIPLAGAPSPAFPPRDAAVVKAIACEMVYETKRPLSRQSLADVTDRAGTALAQPISRSTVWRILDADAITPWQDK